MGFLSRLIGTPLGWIMWLIYSLISNYAIAIIIFTLIIKIILFPLMVKNQKNSAAMAAFSPKLEKLKKQYANNPQKLQEAQMALYDEEGINPMASCTPMLIQLPILYGVLDVVYRPVTHILRLGKDADGVKIVDKAIEICRGIEGIGDIKGFAQREEIYLLKAVNSGKYDDLFSTLGADVLDKLKSFDYTLFGFIDLGEIPTLKPEVWNAPAVGLLVIALASGVIQLLMTIYQNNRQKRLNPEAAQQMASMNIMLYTLPLLSIWMAFSFPAAMGFYWAVSSLLSFFQTIILYKIYTPEYVAELIEKDKQKRKKKNKPNMMQRYMEMMAAQNGGTVPTTARTVSESGNTEEKLSKSKQKEYERKIIAEARRRQAEKYGEEFDENEDGRID